MENTVDREWDKMKNPQDKSSVAELLRQSLQGNDTTLETDGHFRDYWYSIRDFNLLLFYMRQEHLTTFETDRNLAGEPYSPNEQGIYVSNAVAEEFFSTIVEDDLQKVVKKYRDKSMPLKQIIIPILYHVCHFRVLRILIDLEKHSCNVLVNDPAGSIQDKLREEQDPAGSIQDKLREEQDPAGSIQDKLREEQDKYKKLLEDLWSKLFPSHELEVQVLQKHFRQQPIGNNYDCGPISLKNIDDYLSAELLSNDDFQIDQHYSIQATSPQYETQLKEIRNAHKRTLELFASLEQQPSSQYLTNDNVYCGAAYDEGSLLINSLKLDVKQRDKVLQLSGSKFRAFVDLYYENQESGQGNSIDSLLSKVLEQESRKLSLESEKSDDTVPQLTPLADKMQQMDSYCNEVPFNVSGSDFEAYLRDRSLYLVDKSLFIKAVLDLPARSVIFLSRPRRFGKSSNLSLLYAFLSMEVDKSGEVISSHDRKTFFEDRLIYKNYPDLADQNLGQHPCIRLSFSKFKVSEDIDCFWESIGDEMCLVYERFTYLLRSSKLNTRDREVFQSILEGKSTRVKLMSSLFLLTKYLHDHFGKSVYVLIDEVDYPIVHARDEALIRGIIEFIRTFLSEAFKDNPNLEKAVLMGVIPISLTEALSGLNNVSFRDIIHNDKFSPFFGFDDDEMEELFERAQLKDERIRRRIKEYYGGYYIGGKEYCNPYSVANCFSNRVMKDYLVSESASGHFALSAASITADLLRTCELLVSNYDATKYTQNKQWMEWQFAKTVKLVERDSAFPAMLVYSGHITLRNVVSTNGSHEGEARIPNREVRNEFQLAIVAWIRRKLSIQGTDLDGLKIEDPDSLLVIQEQLNRYLDRIVSYNERTFHSLIDAIYFSQIDTHAISMEKKASRVSGRFDTIWFPLIRKSTRVIIIEYKYLDAGSTLTIDQLLRSAHFQVLEKKYLRGIFDRAVKQKLDFFKDIEIRAVVVVKADNDKVLLHYHSKLLSMDEARAIEQFAAQQTDWDEVKRESIESFYERGRAKSSENTSSAVTTVAIPQAEFEVTEEMNDFLMTLPTKGGVQDAAKKLLKGKGQVGFDLLKDGSEEILAKEMHFGLKRANKVILARNKEKRQKLY